MPSRRRHGTDIIVDPSGGRGPFRGRDLKKVHQPRGLHLSTVCRGTVGEEIGSSGRLSKIIDGFHHIFYSKLMVSNLEM